LELHACDTSKTKIRLAVDLAESEAPYWMIERARQGYYDDYESHLATPLHQLVEDAQGNGLPLIAKNAKEGVYDGTQEEARVWMEREGKGLLGI